MSWWVGVSRADWARRVATETPRMTGDRLEGVMMPRSWLDEDQVTLRARRDVNEKPQCPHCDVRDSAGLLYRFRTTAKETWYCTCCSKNFDVETGGEPR